MFYAAKSLMVGVKLDRIYSLRARVTPEARAGCESFAAKIEVAVQPHPVVELQGSWLKLTSSHPYWSVSNGLPAHYPSLQRHIWCGAVVAGETLTKRRPAVLTESEPISFISK